ncbi:hypothetical protein ACSLBF_11190 [Pseudoalteromonas sp. T1lg65]|uniref:hypothetical protein n=1 Tax=Pseudoalteromonas sp. T1lg65 TaxID=2077101 RepID=UPI003F78BFFC
MFKGLWQRWFGNSSEQKVNINSAETMAEYQPITKHYVFNETGNIMLCATADSIDSFDDNIKSAFMDVSIFFAAMTKALSSTENPVTKKPFSIFNYQAVKNMLASSGVFVETNVEEGYFASEGVGGALGAELIKTVLNRNFDDNQLSFAKGMLNGMGYQGVDEQTWASLEPSHQDLCRSGNIFFIGELLLGLPQTSAVLINIEPHSVDEDSGQMDSDHQSLFKLGLKNEKKHQSMGKTRNWKYKKRTYLFIPPRFFENNIARLGNVESPEFADYVKTLEQSLTPLCKQVKQNGTP